MSQRETRIQQAIEHHVQGRMKIRNVRARFPAQTTTNKNEQIISEEYVNAQNSVVITSPAPASSHGQV